MKALRRRVQHEQADYSKALSMLPPAIRAEWDLVVEQMEHFDGEAWAALAYLMDWMKKR